MKKPYYVSFQYSADVFCTNIAMASCVEDVQLHYAHYNWVSIREASESDVKTAEMKGMPFIDVPCAV